MFCAIMIGTCFYRAAVPSDSYFIDNDVQDHQLIVYELRNDIENQSFELFSHGRSGELLINGSWLNAEQISKWITLSPQIKTLNIYGCEFAKGEKGMQAVAYLEKTLGVKVNASTNITGANGDWILEVGDIYADNFEGYSYSLQCANQGVSEDQDFDCDGITNINDLDDDNDGILDIDENCTETIISNITGNVSWPSGSTLSITNSLVNGVEAEATSISTRTGQVESYSLLGEYKLSGTTDMVIRMGSGEVQLTYTFSPAIPASEFAFSLEDVNDGGTFSVQLNGGSATFSDFRVIATGITGDTTFPYDSTTGISAIVNDTRRHSGVLVGSGLNTIETITLKLVGLNTGGMESIAANLLPLIHCDTDNDTIVNKFDLDSDGDGCPDAVEGGLDFLAPQLTLNTSINGGNSGTDFTGDGAAVQQNLGVAVDSNGVPTILDTNNVSASPNGQTVGNSQSNNIGTICCSDASNYPGIIDSDGDGIGNVCDIDIDNDGVINSDECQNQLSLSRRRLEFNGVASTSSFHTISTGDEIRFKSVYTLEDGTIVDMVYDIIEVNVANPSTQSIFVFSGSGKIGFSGMPPASNPFVIYDVKFFETSTTNSVSLPSGTTYTAKDISPSFAGVNTSGDQTHVFGVSTNDVGVFSYGTALEKEGFLGGGPAGFNYYRTAADPVDFWLNIGDADINDPDYWVWTTYSGEYSGGRYLSGLTGRQVENIPVTSSFDSTFLEGPCDDTDNDGIINSLDLDSDGDGCPDTKEASVSPTTELQRANVTNGNGTDATANTTTSVSNAQLNPNGVDANNDGLNDSVDEDIDGFVDYSSTYLTEALNSALSTKCFCYKTGVTGTGLSSINGISTLNREIPSTAAATSWPLKVNNGLLVLDSKEKGFVITRMADPETTFGTDAVEGMLVYDTDNNCLKMFNGTSWACLVQTCVDN